MGRADLHMHTTHSDGILNAPTLMNALAILNQSYMKKFSHNYLDVIAVTDHDNINGSVHAFDYSRANKLGIGVFLGSEISSSDGHILGINIQDDILKGKNAKYTIDAIHEQGGIAIAPHPYSSMSLLGVRSLGDLIKTHQFDAVEIVNSNITELFGNTYTKLVNTFLVGAAEVGNSDAHFYSAFEKAYTIFPGRTKRELLEAIKNKRTEARGRVWGLTDILLYLKDKKSMEKFCQENNITPHMI